MSTEDRDYWDQRYDSLDRPSTSASYPPKAFLDYEDEFPRRGDALVLACGSGSGSVWLAERGLQVWGVDVSPIAVQMAQDLSVRAGLETSCHFEVFDLDQGLPKGPPVDLILCNMFHKENIVPAITERLVPGGLVAMAVLSEVGSRPGHFTVEPGQLVREFAGLEIIAEAEGDGRASVLARAPQ